MMKTARRFVLTAVLAGATLIGIPQTSSAYCFATDVPGLPECWNPCTVAGSVIARIPAHEKLPVDSMDCPM